MGVGVLTCCLLMTALLSVVCGDLYAFGDDAGDTMGLAVDNGVDALPMPSKVKFFTHTYDVLYINTDGTCSFGASFPESVPESFPLNTPDVVAALFWADHDLSVGVGKIWYRASNDSALLDRAAKDVSDNFANCAENFTPKYVYVATWSDVTYNGVTEFDVCVREHGEVFCTCVFIDGLSEEYCECMVVHDHPEYCECVTSDPEQCPFICDCIKSYNGRFCDCLFLNIGSFSVNICNCFRQFPDRDRDFCECFAEHNNEEFCDCIAKDPTDPKWAQFCDCLYFTSKTDEMCECLHDNDYDTFFCENCYNNQIYCDCLDLGFSEEICQCYVDGQELDFCKCFIPGGDFDYCSCRYIQFKSEEFCYCFRDRSYDIRSYDLCDCISSGNDEYLCSCMLIHNDLDFCTCMHPNNGIVDPLFCYCWMVREDDDFCFCYTINYNCELCECVMLTGDYLECYGKMITGKDFNDLSEVDKAEVKKQFEDDSDVMKMLAAAEARSERRSRSYVNSGRMQQHKMAREAASQYVEGQDRTVSKQQWLDKKAAVEALRESLTNPENKQKERTAVDITNTMQRVYEARHGSTKEGKARNGNIQTAKAGTLLFNTYQAVFITNGFKSFVIYNYKEITWTTGDSAGGVNGLGGTLAAVGLNKRLSLLGYNHPFSMKPELFDLVTESNTGVAGQWMYMISKNVKLLGPECVTVMVQP